MNVLIAALGILGVSASGPLISATLAGTTVGALAIAFWRNAIAAVVLGAGPMIRNPRAYRGMSRSTFGYSTVAAVALAFHFICFILALSMTSVAAATALVCLQSAWVAVLQMFRGTRHGPNVLIGLAVALGGVIVITGFDMGTTPTALLGDILALIGGLLAAIYTMAGARARQELSTGVYASLCYAVCAVVVAVVVLFVQEPLVGFSSLGWLGIAAITIAAQLIGHTALNFLVGHMSPLVVSMLVLLEIPGAALLANVFLHEVLPAGIYVGLGLIIAGLAVVTLGQRRSTAPEDPGLGAD